LDLLPTARILGGPATLLTSRGPFGATPELGSLAPLRCFVGGRLLDDPSTEQRSRCSAEKVPTNSGKLMGYPDTMEYVWDNDGIFSDDILMSVNLVSSFMFFQKMFDSCVDAAVPARKASRESLVTGCCVHSEAKPLPAF
jgi:hypothetical protein